MKRTRKKSAHRTAPAKKTRHAPSARYLAKLVRDGHAIDLEDAKHVAELVRRGMLKLGRPGPALPELLRPGPSAPHILEGFFEDRNAR